MKKIAWILMSVAVIGLLTKIYALFFLALVLGVGVGVFTLIAKSAHARTETVPVAIRPFAQMRDEIAALAADPLATPEARAIAQDLALEAQALYERARVTVQADGNRAFQQQLAKAESDLKRLDEGTGAQAKRAEIAHYKQALEANAGAWTALTEALAAIGELRARLIAGATPAIDEKNDMIERIKLLSKSYEEATDAVRIDQQ